MSTTAQGWWALAGCGLLLLTVSCGQAPTPGVKPGTAAVSSAPSVVAIPVSTPAAAEPAAQGPARVELRPNTNGQWRFVVNGSEFSVRGAGGASAAGLLEALRAAGGNCVRTWGLDALDADMGGGERFIDRAHRLGLMVVPGIWLGHERHGFRYDDPEQVQAQRACVLEGVRRYRNHPAVLCWGLGNEMEGPTSIDGSEVVLREVEELARLVKAEDPAHPVMTIIAFQPAKIGKVRRLCPSVDILGLNAYGSAGGVGAALKGAGWVKPFALTEFAFPGSWEVPATAWGAPFEPTSHEKARTYYATHELVSTLNTGCELCLGTFAFLWGWKQERTATWYGMFLPTGEKLGAVDGMARAWTGSWPSNRCPKLVSLASPAAGVEVLPGRALTAVVEAIDPEGDPLTYEWELAGESAARSEGGDAEAAPPTHPEAIHQAASRECAFVAPAAPGDYRMFVTVRDGRGSAATANFPFRVSPAAEGTR